MHPGSDRPQCHHHRSCAGEVVIPQRHVAADGCCNKQAAANGAFEYAGVTSTATSGLPFTQLSLCELAAADATLSVPYGAVMYVFDALECPPSWEPWMPADGRTIVPGYIASGGFPVVSVDPPLYPGEDRAHTHTYVGSVNVGDVSFEGVDGCCNDAPGAAGDAAVSNATDAGSLGLPYVTVLTCMSTVNTLNVSLPPAAMLFSPGVGCIDDWVLASTVSGRFLVAVPDGGQVGEDFGASSLPANATSAGGTRHALSTNVQLPSVGVGLGSGCCADGYAAAGSAPLLTVTAVEQPAFPFISVPACVQDGGR